MCVCSEVCMANVKDSLESKLDAFHHGSENWRERDQTHTW